MKKRDPVEKFAVQSAVQIAALIDQINSRCIYPVPDYGDPRIETIRKILRRAYFELLYVEHTSPLCKLMDEPHYFR